MAVFLVPVAGGVVGAGYLLGLTKAYTSSANFCAKKLSGCEADPYLWPFWKSWSSSEKQDSHSTWIGTIGSLTLFGASLWLQHQVIWRHLSERLKTPGMAGKKIQNTAQFITIVGPSIVANTCNGFGSAAVAGAVRPLLDGRRHDRPN